MTRVGIPSRNRHGRRNLAIQRALRAHARPMRGKELCRAAGVDGVHAAITLVSCVSMGLIEVHQNGHEQRSPLLRMYRMRTLHV